MKKLIVTTVFALGLVISTPALTINANNSSFNEFEVAYTTEVNTFCKLITKGDYDAVKSMLVAGTNVNQKSKGMTPLMYAARYNKADIVKLLIQHGANLKVTSDQGYTALEYAKMSKAFDTHKIIAEAIETQKLERKKKRKNRRNA
ncbi:MAG: ankyrin repeat domain-containing protein [Flavobacteriaceae bacterium]|nr:ankyrin repeat domain-containing protein [Flavobacteriaceae bacterium]